MRKWCLQTQVEVSVKKGDGPRGRHTCQGAKSGSPQAKQQVFYSGAGGANDGTAQKRNVMARYVTCCFAQKIFTDC